jgi:hypothetical protein
MWHARKGHRARMIVTHCITNFGSSMFFSVKSITFIYMYSCIPTYLLKWNQNYSDYSLSPISSSFGNLRNVALGQLNLGIRNNKGATSFINCSFPNGLLEYQQSCSCSQHEQM